MLWCSLHTYGSAVGQIRAPLPARVSRVTKSRARALATPPRSCLLADYAVGPHELSFYIFENPLGRDVRVGDPAMWRSGTIFCDDPGTRNRLNARSNHIAVTQYMLICTYRYRCTHRTGGWIWAADRSAVGALASEARQHGRGSGRQHYWAPPAVRRARAARPTALAASRPTPPLVRA